MLLKKSITDLGLSELEGKRVLVRVDFNVPLSKNGDISDNTRIYESIPTIKYLIQNKAKIILVSHLGRPNGTVQDALRLTSAGKTLSELLGIAINKLDASIGADVEEKVSRLQNGDVLLLENLRFHKEETENKPEFAKQLAGYADIYVNDAFGTAHRAHASTAGVAKYLPAYAGLLMKKEIDFLDNAVRNPQRPFIAIIGGAKISTKICVLENLLGQVDVLIIGGAMAYTFLKAQGLEIGKSLCEEDKIEDAKHFLENAKNSKTKVILPLDHAVVDDINNPASLHIAATDKIPASNLGVDIGPKTIEEIQNIVKTAKTVLWNGPLGIFEIKEFSKGTFEVAHAVANCNGITIIGGGDSSAALTQSGLNEKITHISTGGGAALEFLEGKLLPGVAVLEDKA
jgi:phosphoglycerate kinase